MDIVNTEKHLVFRTVVYAGKLYSYQTGHFTVTPSKGIKYVFIICSYDDNAILSDTLKIELERIFYMPTPHVMTTSSTGDLSPKLICWIMRHPMPSGSTIGTSKWISSQSLRGFINKIQQNAQFKIGKS